MRQAVLWLLLQMLLLPLSSQQLLRQLQQSLLSLLLLLRWPHWLLLWLLLPLLSPRVCLPCLICVWLATTFVVSADRTAVSQSSRRSVTGVCVCVFFFLVQAAALLPAC